MVWCRPQQLPMECVHVSRIIYKVGLGELNATHWTSTTPVPTEGGGGEGAG